MVNEIILETNLETADPDEVLMSIRSKFPGTKFTKMQAFDGQDALILMFTALSGTAALLQIIDIIKSSVAKGDVKKVKGLHIVKDGEKLEIKIEEIDAEQLKEIFDDNGA